MWQENWQELPPTCTYLHQRNDTGIRGWHKGDHAGLMWETRDLNNHWVKKFGSASATTKFGKRLWKQ